MGNRIGLLGLILFGITHFNLANAEDTGSTTGWAKYIQQQHEAEEKTHPEATVAKVEKKTTKKKQKLAKKVSHANRLPAGERNALIPNTNPSAVRPSQNDSPVNESPQEEETRLTKNWGGARTKLSNIGIDIALIYKGNITRNFTGGINPHTDYLGNVDFRTAFDFEKMVGWKGGSAFFYVLDNHGGHPTEHVGDYQSTQNIETRVAAVKIYEAWLQQTAFDGKVSLLVGLHDLNSEFYVTDTSGLFLNNSFVIGADLLQTGVNGPSVFPSTATAIRLRAEPTKNFYIQTAVFDAQAGNPNNLAGTYFRVNGSDGELFITEAAIFNGKDNPHELYGKYGVGIWNYTRTFDTLIGGEKGTNHGVYFIGEQFLLPSVAVFLRYGTAASEVNRIHSNLATGVSFNGLFGRPKDRFGVGFTTADQTDEYIAAVNAAGGETLHAESTFEFTYRYEMIPGLALQPDLQYVMHPGMDPALHNALAGALRVELNF